MASRECERVSIHPRLSWLEGAYSPRVEWVGATCEPSRNPSRGNSMPAFPTSTTVLDSILFRDAFGTPAMREVFSDFSLISGYAEVEIALAKAEARCGVIPAEAAKEIARRTDVSKLDFDLLRRETDVVGYPIL